MRSLFQECDKEARVVAIIMSLARLITFYSTWQTEDDCVCVCVAEGSHFHLTQPATSITFYFQQSALLLIGIFYCCFMQHVLQVVQSLTPLLDFNASVTGAVWTFTLHSAGQTRGTLYSSPYIFNTLFSFGIKGSNMFKWIWRKVRNVLSFLCYECLIITLSV